LARTGHEYATTQPKTQQANQRPKCQQPQMNHKTTRDQSSCITQSDQNMITRKERKQQCTTNYIKTASQLTITMQQTTEKTQNNEITKKSEQQPRTSIIGQVTCNTTRHNGTE